MKRTHPYYFTIALTACIFLSPGHGEKLYAQSYHFTNYSVEHGLQFVFVGALYQDPEGYLWAGGYGGLSRFDGSNFTHYGAQNNLVNHDVQSITGLDNGEIWIGTLGGLSMLKNDVMTNFLTEDGLLSNAVNTVYASKSGAVWIGTENGVNVFTDGVLDKWKYNSELLSPSISAFLEDKNGNILIGTKKGLAVLDAEDSNKPYISKELCEEEVTTIFQDKSGVIWVGTKNGLCKFQLDMNEVQPMVTLDSEKIFRDIEISAIVQSPTGNIWIGTSTGLIMYDGEKYQEYPIGKSANSNIIGSLYYDIEGNLWIGTYSGLFKYRGNSFITYSTEEGLSGNFIFPILRDSRNDLWVGTNTNGLNRYDGEKFEVFREEDGLADDAVKSAFEDRSGNLWIGTDSGLTKIMVDPISKKVSMTTFTKEHGLVSDLISYIMQDEQGRLYFGGTGGITIYSNKRFESYHLGAPYEKVDIWAMVMMEDDKLWIGTYKGGLFTFNGQKFIRENERIGLKSDVCLAMTKDDQGSLWIGTFEGVFRYDGSSLDQFSEQQGLTSNLVYTLNIDLENKNLWIGTNQGLNKLKLGPYYESKLKIIEHYGKAEGFVGVECNSNGAFNESDGSIWFGTIDGLTHYKPHAYFPNRREAQTNILGTRIYYQDTTLENHAVLSYDQNHISFDYVGICLTNPSKVSYQYRLSGYDKLWSPISQNQTATYSNLPPGKYEFQVKSCNNEFKWNEEPTSFSFSITAPYWQTWWFKISSVLAFSGLISLLFFLRIKSIRKSNELNRRMDSLKLEALRSQMNPHFIFNSMNAIQHYINGNDKKLANDYLTKFASLMRLILDNAQKETIPISDDLEALNLYVALEQLRFENKFTFSTEIGKGIDPDYVEIPPNLIQPFVENAINHGLLTKESEGNVSVSMEMVENYLICVITDNGIGREASGKMPHSKFKIDHKSLGMQITRDRIQTINELQDSELNILIEDLKDDNGKATGTRVKMRIPIEIED